MTSTPPVGALGTFVSSKSFVFKRYGCELARLFLQKFYTLAGR